jgi:hypothetical protein
MVKSSLRCTPNLARTFGIGKVGPFPEVQRKSHQSQSATRVFACNLDTATNREYSDHAIHM